MGYYRKFAALLALSCFAYTCSVTALAAESLPEVETPAAGPVEAPPPEQLPPVEDVPEDDWGEVVVEDDKNVYHIEADTIIIQPVAGDFPFYGSCWVTGTATGLGNVTLFFPVNYKEGYIGTDNLGRLFNVSNNTWTGVLYDSGGASYTVNFSAFSLPYYRRYNGTSYTNVTLYLVPEDGNILFPDSPGPVYSLGDLLPYISILLLGGVFVCCMRRA